MRLKLREIINQNHELKKDESVTDEVKTILHVKYNW